MNPYQLNLSVIQHIDALVKQSKLSRAKRDDIKRELTAFAEDYGRELHFDGKDATEIDALVIAAIGTPEQRGKEFTIANQKLLRIPWIGPLFYDDIVRGGVVICLMHLGLIAFGFSLMILISEIVYLWDRYASAQYVNGLPVERIVHIINLATTGGPFLLLAVVLGALIRFRFVTLTKSIDVLTASFLPVFFFFLYAVLQQVFAEYPNLNVSVQRQFFVVFPWYVFPAYFGLLISPIMTKKLLSQLPLIRKRISL